MQPFVVAPAPNCSGWLSYLKPRQKRGFLVAGILHKENMSKHKKHKEIEIYASWKERGVALVLAHPDDEVLYWKLIECLC